MADKEFDKKKSLPGDTYGMNVFGNALLYSLSKQMYLMGVIFLFALSIGSENAHLMFIPIAFLLIARHRYIVTKREKIVEKHTSTIVAIQSEIASLTGESVTETQVARLWLDRIIRTEQWLLHIRPSANNNVELVGIKRKTT